MTDRIQKVNLLLNNHDGIRNGYLNLDPFASGQDDRVAADIFNLSTVVETGEVGELVSLNVLDYVPTAGVDGVIFHWASLLAHGGTLSISVLDIRSACRSLLDDSIDIGIFNSMVHGKQEHPWQIRKNSLSLNVLADLVRAKGLSLISKRIEGHNAIVIARRP